MTEKVIEIERLEQAVSLFGSFDHNVRLIEKQYGVTILNRDTVLKITGDTVGVEKA